MSRYLNQYWLLSLRPRRNRRHFTDDIFKCIFLNENVWILIKISLKFVPKGPINNIPALVQIMAWRRPGDKPLSEPMMVSLPTDISITRPQWVKITATFLGAEWVKHNEMMTLFGWLICCILLLISVVVLFSSIIYIKVVSLLRGVIND